jgi:hypothetical protein
LLPHFTIARPKIAGGQIDHALDGIDSLLQPPLRSVALLLNLLAADGNNNEKGGQCDKRGALENGPGRVPLGGFLAPLPGRCGASLDRFIA